MPHIYPNAYFDNGIRPFTEANLSVASSAVLYGLSVYTVFHVAKTERGLLAFRMPEHYKRMVDSAKIIGIDTFPGQWTYDKFVAAVRDLFAANQVKSDAFVRVSLHVDALLPGTRSRGMHSLLSMFIYDAAPIVPRAGARLKTSLWRRIPDNAIPSRAKVNGAYVNSVLARQDAIDSGYDDCVLLDMSGHVCELSAANIFMVRDGVLITPDAHSDLLEGINRKSLLQLAGELGIPTLERFIDQTELYIADEVLICGTSSFITPVVEIDGRRIGEQPPGPITRQLQAAHEAALRGDNAGHADWATRVDQ
ncbi:MAG: aminotransferase class IV [Steroidobacteraceae bacterium]